MGIEAFGVSIKFVKSGVYRQVTNILQDYPDVHLGNNISDSGYTTVTGEYADGLHFIDLQLSQANTDNKCTLAVRFSLCSYESIDRIFTEIVSNALSSLEAEVWLMTSALKQKANYLPGDERWLASVLPDEIAAMREHWQRSFGKKQGCVRVEDSFSFIGLNVKP